MKRYLFLISLLFLSAYHVSAQDATEVKFETYAKNQYQLLVKAYTDHDTATGKTLLADFTGKYNQLQKADKALYKPYIMGSYYNISCLYSLMNDKPQAFAYLDSAVNKGYLDYKHLQEDTDFANIKTEPRFKQISKYMRSLGDFEYILTRAEKYNPNDKRKIPAFTYQPATDASLVALRKKFKLDSVAGHGDETSKVINILNWVHNTVAHDGQHESGIKIINADEVISAATTKHIGVSCGELATTLNDCYLALGFKSRKVYCFPKDSLGNDFDSHVINVVYLPSKNKWVWADPTNDAYVMDENKNLLSIAEVRERLIKNKPLFINADANWNHKDTITKAFYLDTYMVKNLYRFYSPLKSEYNYETNGQNKTITYVYLMPLDYFKQSPDRSVNQNKDTGFTVERYLTNNADQFGSCQQVANNSIFLSPLDGRL